MTTETITVAGIEFRLKVGHRYVAGHSMVSPDRVAYPIRIVDADGGPYSPVIIPNETDGYTIAEADAFLEAWNNI